MIKVVKIQYTVEDVSTGGASITKNLKFSKSQIAVKIYQEFASDYLVLIISGAKIKCS